MTRQRNDNHSTEFGLWLRGVDSLDSKNNKYTASNLDFIWSNYETELWLLIEEKRFMSDVRYAQAQLYKKLHDSIVCDKYKGTHLIQFEKTNPEDGRIFINDKEFTKEGLIRFLSFEKEVLTYAALPKFITG